MTQKQIFDSSNNASYFLEYSIKDWQQLDEIKGALGNLLNKIQY